MDGVRVRFAPSPTGLLHLGGLRTALYNYLFVLKHNWQNSRFILRIEDTDRQRTLPDAARNIFDTLSNCGIHFHESPFQSPLLPSVAPYFQSERLDIYHHYAKILLSTGHAYKCYCSKERLELLRHSSNKSHSILSSSIYGHLANDNSLTTNTARYDGYCRDRVSNISSLEDSRPYVLRLRIPPFLQDPNTLMESRDLYISDKILKPSKRPLNSLDDIILLKSDGWPTYHFANVVDDHLMDITHVLRGQVLLLNSA